MGHYYHRKKRRKLKSIEKKILLLTIPLAFVIAISIQVVLKGFPKWVLKIILNTRKEEIISRAITKGSAVRRETHLRKSYEKKYRETEEEWDDKYQEFLQNTKKDEIKEYEKKFEKELD